MTSLIRTPEELEGMRAAGRAAASVLEMIGEHVRAGVTTGELDRICHTFITEELDSVPAPLNYQPAPGLPPFPRSVCTSLNHVVCHGIPSDDKKLKRGDLLNIDVTVIKDGWHGDTSKMFAVGTADVLGNRLMRVTQECMSRGIAAVRPGARLGDIGHAIQRHAESERFSVVREYCGHGIGKKFHDAPQILHYGKPGEGPELIEGMAFTIEPMINAGARHVKLLKDHWTVVTKDHRPSAQWEHTILVTANGAEVLTRRGEETLAS